MEARDVKEAQARIALGSIYVFRCRDQIMKNVLFFSFLFESSGEEGMSSCLQ